MRAQEHGRADGGMSESVEQAPEDGIASHARATFESRGAIPPVVASVKKPPASASDRAFGKPGEPPEVTNARELLLQVDPEYGTPGAQPDAGTVVPVIKRILEAAKQHADQPHTALELVELVKPYARNWSAVGNAIHEVQFTLEHHARTIEVKTGGTATESGATQDAPAPVVVESGTPIDAPPVSGSFLGEGISAHPVLLKRLAAAEKHLEGQLGASGAELRKALGVRPGFSILRPKMAYHAFALAIDINYSSNPWIGGQPGETKGDNEGLAAIYHACLLTGRGQPVSPSDSAHRHAKPGSTGALWDHLHEADQALETYLMAHNNLAQVQEWIDAGNLARALTPPPGVPVDDLRLRKANAETWLEQIQGDRERTHGKAATQSNWWMTGAGQRTDLGFLDLDKRLVLALCDVGGLAWGAADFGETQSGDMMHFDCRHDYAKAQLDAALAKLP